jgi:seryl-tRNA synthetase
MKKYAIRDYMARRKPSSRLQKAVIVAGLAALVQIGYTACNPPELTKQDSQYQTSSR